MYQNQKYDLKFHYRRALELSVILSLSIVILVMMIYKKFEVDINVRAVDVIAIEVADIPRTRIIKPVIKPVKPTVPVESPHIDQAAPMHIDFQDDGGLDRIDPPPPPPPANELPVSRWVVEVVPTLIGGQQAIIDFITSHNLFPEVASKLGVSGIALIGFTVSTTGVPEDIHIMQEIPVDLGFGIAGMNVMRAMKFTPGIQQDKPVRVEMQQSIRFTAQSR
ncbi:MAG: hypothetical protein HN757_01685 [Calditrichaeota bacterium]|nr:hypothetical protein [Calditrichota bacterium]